MTKKVAVSISGGGEKGAYGVGVVKYLIEVMDLRVDTWVGVSVGALIGSLMCQYSEEEKLAASAELERIFTTVKTEDIHEGWFLGYLGAALFSKPSLRCTKPLRELIDKHLDEDRVRVSGKEFRCGAVSMTSGNYEVFTEQTIMLKKAVEASASFPFMFEPVRMDSEWYADGGVRSVTPIKAAIDAGADVIYAVTLQPEEPEDEYPSKPVWHDAAIRTLDLQSEAIIAKDIKLAQAYTRLANAGIGSKKPVEIHHIRPAKTLPTTLLEFNPEEAKKLVEMGYADAKRILGGE